MLCFCTPFKKKGNSGSKNAEKPSAFVVNWICHHAYKENPVLLTART